MGKSTDPPAQADALNRALPLLARDATALAVAAGTLPGSDGIALVEPLRAMAAATLGDVERLAARIVTLGGTPEGTAAPMGPDASVSQLVEQHREALDALVEAIPADADDAEGEATEHLLEHIIARMRDDLELLERATR
jgi:predicted TPR repeat methyltransferase